MMDTGFWYQRLYILVYLGRDAIADTGSDFARISTRSMRDLFSCQEPSILASEQWKGEVVY